AGGLAAAAGVLAFCGIGAKVIGPIDGPMSAGGSSADRPAITTENGPAGSDLTDLTVQQQIASGADYRRQTLAQRVAPAAPFAGSSVAPGNGAGPGESGQDKNSGGAPGAQAVAAPAALRPLTEPVALDRCLGAIGTEHGRQAVSVDLVDYASFEGTPAVIVVFTDVSGERWGWVVGPACGRADAGADSRYRTTVG
ncbi:MAG TPA: hypothetical protein VES42_24660, partial [Pilimelia sp.]|nr:hypothetical protein [Pilimelia sp.]